MLSKKDGRDKQLDALLYWYQKFHLILISHLETKLLIICYFYYFGKIWGFLRCHIVFENLHDLDSPHKHFFKPQIHLNALSFSLNWLRDWPLLFLFLNSKFIFCICWKFIKFSVNTFKFRRENWFYLFIFIKVIALLFSSISSFLY